MVISRVSFLPEHILLPWLLHLLDFIFHASCSSLLDIAVWVSYRLLPFASSQRTVVSAAIIISFIGMHLTWYFGLHFQPPLHESVFCPAGRFDVVMTNK